ncbi:hypothetical protein GWI33_022678 [Rhynchophorus ferrugineus]|uniref:Uncharacterized protein n=1 Tax=Rhynchophorus ferrugineus TaxID=354439 RepID=A0A834IPJ8_RHYFE|nr:hypothetical protein GWI33_022678 [Rhynchophorus ferrugineus]
MEGVGTRNGGTATSALWKWGKKPVNKRAIRRANEGRAPAGRCRDLTFDGKKELIGRKFYLRFSVEMNEQRLKSRSRIKGE